MNDNGRDSAAAVVVPARPSPGRNVLWIASVAVVYFAVARFSLFFVLQPEAIAAFWPAEGIFISAILLTHPRLRPYLIGVLFLTEVMVEVVAYSPARFLYPLALTGSASFSAWLLLRFANGAGFHRRARDVVAFLALSVVLSNGLFSLLAAAATMPIPGTSFFRSWKWWAGTNAIGNLLVTPFILSWASRVKAGWGDWKANRPVEGAILFVSLAALYHYAFNHVTEGVSFTLLVAYLSFPFLIWAALRFRGCEVTLALIILAAISLDAVIAGRLPGFESRLDALIVVQLYLAVLAIPALFLAAVMNERREAETTLRESQRLLQTLVEAMPDAVFVKDLRGRYRLFNPGAARVTGKGAAEALGNDDTVLFPADQAVAIMETDRRVVDSGKTVTFEEDVATATGEKATFLSTKGPMVDERGDITGLFGIARDITEQRRSGEALARSEANLAAAQRIAHIGSWEWDVAADTGSWSEETCRIFGVAHGSVDGRREIFRDALHPEDRELVDRALRDALDGTKEYDFVYRIVRPDKAVKFIHARAEVVRDAAGGPVSMRGTVHDITDRARDEEERLRLQGQLQQAMKMEAVGRLAGGVAHDFNNILTAIMGNLALARAKLSPSDPAAGRLDEANRAAERAAALTQQLLTFSRKQIIAPRVLDLNGLITDMHKMLVRVIGEDVELQTVPGSGLGAVKVDPGQFEQILVNLAVNARDAMPGGGTLLIETSNVDLDDAYCASHPDARPGRHVLLAVSDTGHGMTDEVKAHLFEPFFTTKPRGRGTGLGISMTYGAVKQAGGSIEVYSEVGEGTSFKIYLPRVDETPSPAEKGERPTEMPRGTETVLLVEDEETVRKLCRTILEQLGYSVLDAPGCREAIALAGSRADRIDLLMTDVVMPGMNGRELADRVLQAHPEARLLFTSGYTENVIVHHGVLDEGVAFIGKPYTASGLARKIREVLGKPGPSA